MQQLMNISEASEEGMFVHGRLQERNFSNDERRRSKSRNADKICNYYKKKGHVKTGCFKLQNKKKRMVVNQGKQPEKSSEAGVVELDYSDRELLVAFHGDFKLNEDWILDSGCTFHMTSNRNWFLTYDSKVLQ